MKIGLPDGWEISVDREMLDVTTESEPDPSWEEVDPAGHIHRYRDPASEDWVVETAEWVFVRWDPPYPGDDEPVAVNEMRCRRCGAAVEPGVRSPEGRRFMAGLTTVSGSAARGADGSALLWEAGVGGRVPEVRAGPIVLHDVVVHAIGPGGVVFTASPDGMTP